MPRPSSRTLRRAAVAGGLLAGLAVPSAALAADPVSNAVVLSNDRLASFDLKTPGSPVNPVAVTGLVDGDTLVGIDIRPQNGQLYGLGVNATADTVQLYALSARTGVAKAIGAPITGIQGTDFGFDFNPTVDRIRVVSDTGENFRVNPNTGAQVDGNDVLLGVQRDGDVNGATAVDGSAYTNSQQNATVTALFSLSAADQKLYIQNPPNAGTQTAGKSVTVGGAAANFSDVGGFDIAPNVEAPANNQPPAAGGLGIAAVNVGGKATLASIDLNTGAATVVGLIGDGSQPVQGLAIQQEEKAGGLPAVSLTDSGKIRRFNTATPTVFVETSAITGLGPGETPVAIDWRPQTGQLLLLGVDAASNTGTLYRLDPQATGGAATATRIGLTGSVAFTDGNANTTDLPDPATVGYDIDVNPTVDRVRVVTGSGLNFRLNPNVADDQPSAVDGNGGGIAVQNGTNPDGAQKAANGDTTVGLDVAGTAYTNNEQNATRTTLYTLSSAEGKVALQAPPNAGTQTAAKTLNLLGLPVPITATGGFDIAPGVDVDADDAAAPAGSTGYAALSILGQTTLGRVDLNTGAVSPAGPVGDGQPIQGLAIQGEAEAGGAPAVTVTAATSTTSTLRRFDVAKPATGTEVAITGLTAGEVPAGVAWRPQTGQLLLLGIDADEDRGSLYRLDPQTGAATVIGAAGSVAFRTGSGSVVELPPVATGYDIDVNPTVDRVRVVAASGLNFRLNPTVADGASVAVDGNDGESAAVAGTNPDGKQNGGAADVSGTAYTNGFAQPLTTPPGATTQLGISAAQDQLLIQNPPNAGTQTAAQTIKVGADRLDVTAVRGFAIPAKVRVASPNGVTQDDGLAVLGTAGTAAALYGINLQTAEATLKGTLPGAPTSFALGDGPEVLGSIPVHTVSPLAPQPPNAPVATPVIAKAGFGSSTRLSVKLRATRVSANGPAKVTFRNTNAFAVKVRLQATTPKSGKRRAIRYSTKTYTVKARSSRTVNLRLPAAARKELRTKRKLSIRTTLRVTAPDGKNRTVRKTLTARRK
ncbi:unannotated protein [freshwater metagenome]|uniref:Unannotated protein n=1 Tax=freshwater metagenome TaxID=449393 RepID=A0A6J7H649_9ZZZZ|nr:DUF4394 domain-containing protein [Actinomycetota bacterium]